MKLISQYKGLRRENYVLCFGRLVTSIGSMVWPMMTMILSQKMGMEAERIAWFMAAFGILLLPANMIGGKMADHFNKKMNIIFLDGISVICYVICASVPLSKASVGLMFAAAMCQNMEHPSYDALTADITITDDRERAYSLQYLCMNLGYVISPTIGGILLQNYLWLAFLISGIAIGCSTVLIFFLVKDITPVKESSQKAVYQASREGEGLLKVLKENRIIVLYILAVSGFYAIYQMYNYLVPLDMARLHGDRGAVIFGSITSVNGIVVVVCTPLFTRMFPWVTDTVKTMFGQIFLVAGMAALRLFAGCIPLYYIAAIVLTWGEVLSMLAESPYLTKRIPASHRGRIKGVMGVFNTGVTSLYQLMIGFVYGIGGVDAAWAVILVTGGLFVLLCVLLIVKDKKVYRSLYL